MGVAERVGDIEYLYGFHFLWLSVKCTYCFIFIPTFQNRVGL